MNRNVYVILYYKRDGVETICLHRQTAITIFIESEILETGMPLIATEFQNLHIEQTNSADRRLYFFRFHGWNAALSEKVRMNETNFQQRGPYK